MKLATKVIYGILAALQLVAVTLSGQTFQFTEKEVRFKNGSIELAGTLISPNKETPSPAVVFLHGSGPATRAGARPYAEEFAKMGIASLIFDKRGSGASGGSWLTSSLEDLSRDALAAVEHLKSLNTIDANRIGFWGVSQAAWVATLAASQSADIGFMILISGGGATPLESELFSYRTAMQRANLAGAEIADAERVLGAYFDFLATGNNRAGLVTELEQKQNAAWYKYAPLDRILPSDENRSNWSWVATWDPAPHIEKLTCPVLLLFGDKDTDHPTEIAVRKWREGLNKAGNKGATVMIFPGAGHGIRMRDSHTGGGRAPFADGYAEVMLGWLWQHVVAAKQ